MKYVLVIDVPEPLESEDVKVDYLCYYHCGNIIENKIDVFPKPLPQKREIDIEVDLACGDGYESGYKDGYNRGVDIGFNKCLKEIQNDN